MFNEKEVAILKDVIENWSIVLEAVEIAKDEIMRVKMNDMFWDDSHSDDGSEAYYKSRALFRKMYRHHADLNKYPWSIYELKELSKENLVAYFEDITDPTPDAVNFRPIRT